MNKFEGKDIETVLFHDISVNRNDFKIISELESILGDSIPLVSKFNVVTYGLVIEKNRVITLGLYDRNLKIFPNIICNLQYLKKGL